jgi:hypothetical protein
LILDIQRIVTSEMAKLLDLSRRRIVAGKNKRKPFDNYMIVDMQSIEYSKNSEIDEYPTDFGDDESIIPNSESDTIRMKVCGN